MKKVIRIAALLIFATACGDSSKEKDSSNSEDKKEKQPVEQEVSRDIQIRIQPSGEIALSSDNGGETFNAQINIEWHGLSFSKEVSSDKDGKASANFPEDFGIDEYENPIWEKTDSNYVYAQVKITSEGMEMEEWAFLPVDKSGSLRPLYSDQVEFEQNPVLPKELGGTSGKSWIKFYADHAGFHYLSADYEGKYQHLLLRSQQSAQMLLEQSIPELEIDCESLRVGYVEPQIHDADDNGLMEVYCAYVNSCIGEEKYEAWVEQEGSVLGKRTIDRNNELDEFEMKPDSDGLADQLTEYLKGIYKM